ncbi:MAG: helix-turn-helix domain-containing protein [Bryobacteraceae bacterium]|nr:helix-turn-helix domain-containing protein [Bryobacteraceae bacterium]
MTPEEGSDPRKTDRLDSWKQIAAYLGRSERTVRRWHDTEGLPVHKHLHLQKGSVWAYRQELDRWQESRQTNPPSVGAAGEEAVPAPGRTSRQKVAPALLAASALSGLLYFYVFSEPPAQADLQAVPLTTYPGIEQEPAWSPDATAVAFSWDGGGDNRDIYLLRPGDGSPKRLTTNPLADSCPSWSPDGGRIAFLRHDGAQRTLMVFHLREGRESAISRAAGTVAAWTADGKEILVGEGDVSGARITRVSASTGEQVATDLGGGASWPSPLPGGGLLFGRLHSSARMDLWMAPPKGQPRPLLEGFRIEGAAAVSPDERTVVFAADPRGRPLLFWMPLSGGAPQPLSALGDNAFHPALARSSDGRTHLVYEQRAQGLDILALDLATGAESSFVEGSRSETNPSFSPDGQRFAFSSDRSGAWEIWTARADGSEPVQLTHLGRRRSGVPRYSPDGKHIAFDSALADTDYDVHVVSVEDGVVRRITDFEGEDGRPSWSRDGKFLYYFSERSGSRQIWKAPFPDGAPVQVTRNGGYEAFESPDGKYLYYTFDEERPGLRRIPVHGGVEEDVAPGVTQGYWALGPKGIYYLDWTGAPAGLILRLRSLEPQTDVVLAAMRHRIFRPAPGFSVTADGKRAALSVVNHRESDLMLVRNFR